MAEFSRRTFLTVGGAGLGALLVGASAPPASAASRVAMGRPMAEAAAAPVPASGGTPPGPYTFGWAADDLLAFDPAATPWGPHLRCLIPRATRIAPFAATQAHPDLDPATRLSTLTIDDAGSIYEGHNQPIGLEPQVYTQRYWSYIDIWGTWHGQVKGSAPIEMVDGQRAPGRPYGVIDIPNPGWTEAAHKNGARSIGGWFWPRPVDFDSFLVQNADGSFPVGDKMIEIRRYFGFDGLFINQEGTVTAAQIAKFQDLLRYIKRTDPDFYLQGYDSADFDTGVVTYENRLSENNLRWLGTPDEPIYDSIFMNYWWQAEDGGADPDLSLSAASAQAAGRDPHVVGFAGVEHQKGGFRPEEDFGRVAGPGRAAPTSVALFVDSQIWLDASWDGTTSTVEGRRTYRDLEQRFWSGPTGDPHSSGRLEPRTPPYRTDVLNYRQWDGIAHWITERSPYGELPIATDFNIGVGSGFWLEGAQVRSSGWDNMGCADRSLTWQYWTEGGLAVALDETASYGSGHSLTLRGSGVVHLFKTDLTTPKSMVADLRAQGVQAVELGITWKDAPAQIDWHRLNAADDGSGWAQWGAELDVRGRGIARISLRTSGDGRLGRIVLRAAGKPAKPAKPAAFSVADAGDAGSARRHLTFSWTLQDDATGYDVFQLTGSGQNWLGRVHRDVFFAESVDVAAGTRFQLVAFGADGSRSAPVKAALGG
ncbi:Glycosyl hydrolase family 85 [Microbacterium azadirachtae]|uniref:Glycosyl hydrolase family 85 n=1 Tax=Microbacterium azadirachtae TaxID=582680 RepID=A0A0F0K8Q7_9MICO|nr:hypothetical protein [Microbacterium azadirachtae]KJL17293.1 Glycosyl hydrolase family 85 [Microbacterium azadirachtae]